MRPVNPLSKEYNDDLVIRLNDSWKKLGVKLTAHSVFIKKGRQEGYWGTRSEAVVRFG